MSEYYHIVPWYDSEEWCTVYNKIYSPSIAEKEEALNILLIWKARCPSLPSGVESTLTLLEVYIQDVKNCDDKVNEQLLRLAYSSAIMRFVNHMLDTETAKGTSLYQAAKLLGVPDWIVDMRHDTAHHNNLPSIELLREATAISLEWLEKHYWGKHKLCISDYISGQKETDATGDPKIEALMNFCISLSICSNTRCNIKKLSEIPDPSMTESIVNDARDLFGGHIDLSDLKTVSILSLINLMNMQAKKLLKVKDPVLQVNKALLGEDSLFLSLELLKYLSQNEFYNKSQLSRPYVQSFEVLLTFLNTNDLLLDFILELINITQFDHNETHQRLLAALWVSEILQALIKSKLFLDKLNIINPDDMTKKRKDLKMLYHHWFPGEKMNGLLLDLHKPVPRELTDIQFVQPIISAYNPYLTYFIRDLLNLVEPHLPKRAADNICKLAKLISSPESFPSTSLKIYTVEDVKKSQDVSPVAEGSDNDSDCCEVSFEANVTKDRPLNAQLINGLWKLTSSEHNWASCPIGQLPWQIMNYSEMET